MNTKMFAALAGMVVGLGSVLPARADVIGSLPIGAGVTLLGTYEEIPITFLMIRTLDPSDCAILSLPPEQCGGTGFGYAGAEIRLEASRNMTPADVGSTWVYTGELVDAIRAQLLDADNRDLIGWSFDPDNRGFADQIQSWRERTWLNSGIAPAAPEIGALLDEIHITILAFTPISHSIDDELGPVTQFELQTRFDFITHTPICHADFNGVNGVTVQDIFDFLTAWLAGDSSADFNNTNGVTVQDIFDFLTAWLAGC